MKRLLLPLLAALALPTAVNAEISDKVHERCKDAKDYVGCVQMMSGQKKKNEYGEGTRKLVRSDGNLSLFNPLAISAMKIRGEYGRYLKYRYFLIGNDGVGYQWTVEADCQDYTANWEGDEEGWRNLKRDKKESSVEAKKILDEFCPQMDRLVQEAESGTKENYRYQITAGGSFSGGDGGADWGESLRRMENQRRMQQIEQNQENLRNDMQLNNYYNQQKGFGF